MITGEPLIKSRQKTVCTSCLHIFRHFAQKFSDIRQYAEELFEQTDEKSDGAICTNDLISASLKNISYFLKTSFNAFIALKEVFVNCNFKNSDLLYRVCFERTLCNKSVDRLSFRCA